MGAVCPHPHSHSFIVYSHLPEKFHQLLRQWSMLRVLRRIFALLRITPVNQFALRGAAEEVFGHAA
jgi:hypothetical protein